jgi:threonine aldolase
MIYFDSDYMEGAHPEVMRRLVETNLEHTVGYGCDPYTQQAKDVKVLSIRVIAQRLTRQRTSSSLCYPTR